MVATVKKEEKDAAKNGTAAKSSRVPCMICKRMFPTPSHLKRHERYSELHRSNADQQDQLTHQRKAELKLAMHVMRGHMAQKDAEMQSQAHQDEDQQSQRTLMEMQLRQLLFEYGQAQGMIEDSRMPKSSRRRAGRQPPRAAFVDEKQIGKLSLMAGAAAWQGNKDFQEDRYVLDINLESSEGIKLAGFMVADGHSGSLCVDHLVEKLPGNLQKCLSTKTGLSEESLTQAVMEACVLTDDEFLQKARQQEVLDGSCMILAIIYPEDSRAGANGVRSPGSCRLLIANVGDSRAVLCRGVQKKGEEPCLISKRLSEDHKPIVPSEQKRIEAKGGIVDLQGVWRVFTPGPCNFGGKHIVRWGLAVSRAFGDLLMKEPEKYGCLGVMPGGLLTAVPEITVYDLDPAQDRFLMLACDGVWDVLEDDEALAVCSSQEGAEDAAMALVRRSFAAASDDNLSALIVTWKAVE